MVSLINDLSEILPWLLIKLQFDVKRKLYKSDAVEVVNESNSTLAGRAIVPQKPIFNCLSGN